MRGGRLPASSALAAPLMTLRIQDFGVCCLLPLPDGRFLSGGFDSWIRVTTADGDSVGFLSAEIAVLSLALLTDGTVISGHDGGKIMLWDTTTCTRTRTLEGHSGAVRSLAALRSGGFVSASADSTVRVWPRNGGRVRVLEGHESAVSSVVVLPDARVASGSADGSLRVWASESGVCERVVMLHSDICSLLVVVDAIVACGCADGVIRVVDADTGERVADLEGHTSDVRSLALLHDGRIVSSSGHDLLHVWSLPVSIVGPLDEAYAPKPKGMLN